MVSDRSNGIYRSVIAAVVGLAIVAVALSFLISDLSTVDSAYSHAAADAAVEYERDASTYIEKRCFTPTGLGEPDCAAKAHEAAREGQRKEQDLAAQNITAWWTKVMGIAALIGMALSAVGVWLVKTTFDETRKSNEIARMSQRPWINAEINLEGIARDENGYVLRVVIVAKNYGLSPAIHLRAVVDGFFAHDILSIEKVEFWDARSRMNRAVSEAVRRVEANQDLSIKDGLTVFPNDSATIRIEETITAPLNVDGLLLTAWVVIGLRYSLNSDEGQTVKVFSIPSFGVPNESGFDDVGEYGICFTDTDAKIIDWDSGGYAT
jgi:hypothetical protein